MIDGTTPGRPVPLGSDPFGIPVRRPRHEATVDEATFDAFDEATVEAARAGSRLARSKLLRALQDPWYRMCLGLLGNTELARDATQETAVRFLRQISGFRGDSRVRTWSLGIALNVIREMKRRRTRDPTGWVDGGDGVAAVESRTPTDGAVPTPYIDAEQAEQRERLQAVLGDLPERQREAIVLRFFEDLSVEETAAAMGCAAGTVKATVHQALRSLRRRLKHLI